MKYKNVGNLYKTDLLEWQKIYDIESIAPELEWAKLLIIADHMKLGATIELCEDKIIVDTPKKDYVDWLCIIVV